MYVNYKQTFEFESLVHDKYKMFLALEQQNVNRLLMTHRNPIFQ